MTKNHHLWLVFIIAVMMIINLISVSIGGGNAVAVVISALAVIVAFAAILYVIIKK